MTKATDHMSLRVQTLNLPSMSAVTCRSHCSYRAVHIDDVQDEVRQHKPIGEEAAALAVSTALA